MREKVTLSSNFYIIFLSYVYFHYRKIAGLNIVRRGVLQLSRDLNIKEENKNNVTGCRR